MQQQVLPLEFSHLRGGFLEQGVVSMATNAIKMA
jgi:hypothetical protein